MGTHPADLFPTATAVACECGCGRIEVDEVAAVVLWEGAIAFRDALHAKLARDRRAWQAALERGRAAVRGAGVT